MRIRSLLVVGILVIGGLTTQSRAEQVPAAGYDGRTCPLAGLTVPRTEPQLQ